MLKKIWKNKFWVILGLGTLFLLSSENAFARDHDRGHNRYTYRNGRYHHRGWFGIDLVAPVPPIGAFVVDLPGGFTMVTVGGSHYYHHNNIYYRPYSSGYVVVEEPVAPAPIVVERPTIVEREVATGGTITVNVPNSQGGFTPVKLQKRADGYLGPQGEFYSDNPTIEQLKVLYGK